MQTDFCGKGGYIDLLGYDISLTRACIDPIRRVLDKMRVRRLSRSCTRARGTAPISPTCPPTSAGVRGGHPEMKASASAIGGPAGASWFAASPAGTSSRSWRPVPARRSSTSPGKGSFCATDLDLVLRQRGIANLILTGITTDVCVHTTMREANDRGYECLLVEDCCGATDPGNHAAAVKMVKMQNGVFGSVSTSAALIESLPG